jgi:hypothetical protein
MSSPNNEQRKMTDATFSQSQKAAEFLLSLAVGPVLLGILTAESVFSWLQEVGINSEEVFRGERLPVLHVPESGSEQ